MENTISKQSLKREFEETLSQFTADDKVITALWQDIEKKYAKSSRHYHSLAHLHSLTNTLLQVKNRIHDWDILVLAIAYHDIVYNIRKSDNEEKSAAYAADVLADVLPAEKRELLSQFIIATKAHDRHEDEDINYFTDADLSILGLQPEEYALYTSQIRKEYKLYPLFLYKPGRAKVVRHFLSMDTIFKTEFFYNRLEKQARENLQRELEELK